MKAIIKERKQGDQHDQKGDFLDMLLSVHGLSDDEKVSFVLDALLGGYETTSLLMSMVVHFLGQSLPALEQLEVFISPCFSIPTTNITHEIFMSCRIFGFWVSLFSGSIVK